MCAGIETQLLGENLYLKKRSSAPAAMIPMFEIFKYLAQLIYIHTDVFSKAEPTFVCPGILGVFDHQSQALEPVFS